MYTAEDEEDATRTDFGDGGWSLTSYVGPGHRVLALTNRCVAVRELM